MKIERFLCEKGMNFSFQDKTNGISPFLTPVYIFFILDIFAKDILK